ncbi:alpha/beta hydrolase [Porifericola rhodea]|uniref:alpha/beta fold hydrolase n=1 Tax=Porifericola rhodea TaxID=930972 RepID=UPI0026671F2E|nr:alpha/beta hydrolase [Porifericola rhodea]WKN30345.1 alpha/beta hydrolase [Porifericola rhodea]
MYLGSATFLLAVSLCLFGSSSLAQPVQEDKYVKLGGIEQWVSISGEDKSKAVVLMLHGGPGSVLSPYSDHIFADWKKDFVIVQWDQRGAGKTYRKNKSEQADEDYWLENPLQVEQMVKDGLELCDYLLQHLDKDKLVLMASSWGTVLATQMVQQRPEIFHFYLAHAQLISYKDNLSEAYHKVKAIAEASKDTLNLQKLKTLGPPPYAMAKNLGQLLRIVKTYERQASSPSPEAWWEPSEPYKNELDVQSRYQGDDYSFLYFAGHKPLGIKSMVADLDFRESATQFKVPVYFVQGAHDILTPASMNKDYFEKIDAPAKEFFLVPDAAHAFTTSVVDLKYQILKKFFDDSSK